ncbi:MAG: hypothetical protein WCC60_05965, partial [Ilumatobacteraceae bacterium]
MRRGLLLVAGILSTVLVIPASGLSAAPPAADTFHGLNPARLLDTRPGATTIDHLAEGTGVVGPASVTTLTIAGRGGVPAGTTAGAVALNVTAAAPSAVSYITVWPTGATRPTASNLNLQPDTTTPNMVIVPLGTNGQINLYNDTGTTHLIVDVLGWYPTGNPAATTRVSIATDGTQADDGSFSHAISADGRFVAFESIATTLVAGDTNGYQDLFVRDRIAGVTTRVSVATGGTQANGSSTLPTISGDGRYISFQSKATNLVVGDTNNAVDVFLFDRITGVTTRVSVATGGAQATFGESYEPSISNDGRYIAYQSFAPDLVIGDTNAKGDIFLYDRVAGSTTRITLAPGGAQANGHSASPAISAD